MTSIHSKTRADRITASEAVAATPFEAIPSRPRDRCAGRPRGFTMIELLAVMALLGLMAGLLFPTIQFQFARARTMTSARQIASVLQRARLEAIRRNTPGTVEVGERRVVANVDGVEFFALLASGVDFGAPGGQPIVDGFGATDTARFTIAGGVEASGAFRIVGPRQNFVEVRIDPPATARVQLRKWDGSAFKAQREGGVPWTW